MIDLWIRQVRGVLRLELRKTLFGRRAIPIWLLAGLPVMAVTFFIVVSIVFGGPEDIEGTAGANQIFAQLFQFLVRFVVYFGCVWVFMNLFRGEILDRSLHYYFLCPIRREVLVAGKYISGWISSTLLFSASSLICSAALHLYLGGSGVGDLLTRDPGIGGLLGQVAVVALGCLGYGAVFLLVGLFFRNPIVPAVAIFLWESANFLLPSLLKKISVIFYLQSLFPVPPIDQGPFAVIAAPVSPWLAVPGLIVFTAATLVIAGLRVRTMEISYASD